MLYSAVDPKARGAEFYGPRGFQELAGGGVTEAQIPRPGRQRRGFSASVATVREADRRELSDELADSD